MTPIQRSRRLQTGLASLGIVGAVGASLGIGAATHTASSGGSSGGGTSAGHHSHSPGSSRVRSHLSRPARPQQAKPSVTAPKPSVTAPKPNPPQATTSGS